ncbi:hypothetical protein B566_EDAN007257 [Ephemera danica]|nr:hypothetical protein B566_EDAN007257 [Ephemera danica]
MPTRGNRHGNGGSGGGSNSTQNSSLPIDNFSGSLMRLLAMLLEMAVEQALSRDCQEEQHAQLSPRVQDIVSYAVSAGVFEKLAAYCGGVRDPIDEDQPGALFFARTGGPAAIRQDVSQLGATLRVTELVGGVSMLYGMLLHQGATPRGPGATPPPLPAHTVHVARATLRLLLEVAEMDLALFQGVLGSEGMSLQFRHLSSYLLWACQGVQGHADLLLQDVVRVVGFFAVRNHDNQMTIQSGFTPTVLQQLCTLPFEYFMEEERIRVLMPTLLACCWDNPETRAVLEQELSFQQLEDFRVSEVGRQDSLVSLLQSEATSPPPP